MNPYQYPFCSRVSYPKKDWPRWKAWEHLHAQMIPGCPKVPLAQQVLHTEEVTWVHGWRKCHTLTEWRWEYVGR